MLIPNQMMTIKIGGKTVKYYKSLGFDAVVRKEIIVPAEQLKPTSNVKVMVSCDICGKIMQRAYRFYLENNTDGFDYCTKCCYIKRERTFIDRYGVSNGSQLQDIKDKMKKTNLERYGVENASSTTWVREKVVKTFIERYGVENPNQLESIRQKTIATNLSRYGFEYALQSPQVMEKLNRTMTHNRSCKTSSQQVKLHKMIQEQYQNAILNYPCGRCIFDIALLLDEDLKIDIEYDGWFWHKNQQKDRKRDEYFKNKGWKILRIKSARKLPSSEQLNNALTRLIFDNYRYTEIILDDWKEVS